MFYGVESTQGLTGNENYSKCQCKTSPCTKPNNGITDISLPSSKDLFSKKKKKREKNPREKKHWNKWRYCKNMFKAALNQKSRIFYVGVCWHKIQEATIFCTTRVYLETKQKVSSFLVFWFTFRSIHFLLSQEKINKYINEKISAKVHVWQRSLSLILERDETSCSSFGRNNEGWVVDNWIMDPVFSCRFTSLTKTQGQMVPLKAVIFQDRKWA